MLHQDRVNALRHTHSTVATFMPLLTAGLTVAGAVLAAFEARSATAAAAEVRASEATSETTSAAASQPGEAPAPRAASDYRPVTRPATRRTPHPTSRPGTARRYAGILAGRLLMVVLGLGLTLAIIYAATATGRVGQAITLTALILLTFYLVEKIARQA